MLQKLLIAFCTLFVLSACGGDLDLGPDQAPPSGDGNGDDGGDNGGDGGDGAEPGEPRIFTYIPFDEEADVDAWDYRCVDTCNATATLGWNGTEEVLSAEPEWASDADQLDLFGDIPEVDDMAGAGASLWLYVTEAYVNDGNLTAHLMLENAAGQVGVSRPYEPSTGWNRIEMWEMAAGTGETTGEGDEQTTDYGTFGWHSEGFTLRDINRVGVRLVANGKPVDVTGPVWLDNVTLTPGSGSGPLVVSADDENWTVLDATAEVTLQRSEDGVYFEPTAADQKLVYLLEGPADLVGRSFDMTFTVDQAFKDSGADVQPIIQQNFGSYSGEFSCYVGNGELTAGEPYETTCSTENDAFVAEEGQTIRVGLQVKNEVAGRVTINRLQININSGAGDTGPFELVATQANVDDGTWANDNYQSLAGAADLSFNAAEDALSILPNWDVTDSSEQYNDGERTVMYVAEEGELPDLEGATVGVELFLGEYYTTTNPGLQVQIYIQQNSGSYAGNYGSFISIDAAEDLGNGWYRFEEAQSDVPTDPTAQRVGIKLQGAGLASRDEPGEPILLRRITIE